jgi:hypothetical protein
MILNRASILSGVGVLSIMLVFAAGTASADPLDGRWCMAGGGRMSIDGPLVTTPGGVRMRGEYDRGSLVYAMPGLEPGSELRVSLTLLDEERLKMAINRADAKDARPEIWHRCGPPMI